MSQFELKFLDGPGAGRSVWVDHVPGTVWLCHKISGRYWTFTQPEKMLIEATYKLIGHAPRFDGTALLVYGVADD